MNGYNLINELTKLAQDEKLAPEDGIRILLATQVDLLQNQHLLGDELKEIRAYQAEHDDEFERLKKDTQEWIQQLEESITRTRRELKEKLKEVIISTVPSTTLKKNFFFVVGNWISCMWKKTPGKTFAFLSFTAIVFSVSIHTLLHSDFFEEALRLLLPLGVPEEWIEPLVR